MNLKIFKKIRKKIVFLLIIVVIVVSAYFIINGYNTTTYKKWVCSGNHCRIDEIKCRGDELVDLKFTGYYKGNPLGVETNVETICWNIE